MLVQKDLLEKFEYNEDTGELFRKFKNGKKNKITCIGNHGYIICGFENKTYLAHRIIWIMKFENITTELDHINRIKTDNRICNLRKTTSQQNKQNTGKYSNNTSGFKGVSWHSEANKWEAYFHIKGKKIYLGLFDNSIDAANAYNQKVIEHYGQFAVLNVSKISK